ERHIGKLVGETSQYAAPVAATAEPAGPAPVEWGAFMKSMDGDELLARELVDLFIESGDETLAAIVNALGANDYAAVSEQAHSLKGASANLRATAAAEAAAKLEAAAKAGDVPNVSSLTTALKSEVTRTIDYLRTKMTASA